MSGRRAPHLQRRNGIYHLRVRVPDAVRPLIGRSEVRRSFGTSSYSKARSLAARYAAKVMEAFEVIGSSQLSAAQALAIVQNCFADLQAETSACGGFVPLTDRPVWEKQEQVILSEERVWALEAQIAACVFDGSVAICAEDGARAQGVALDKLAPNARLDILSGVARALIEQQRLFQLRVDDRLTAFVPKDALFAGPAPLPILPHCIGTTELPAKGLTVHEAIKRYLDAGKLRLAFKTHYARTWQLGFFEQHVGGDRVLASVTADHVRSFRDAVRSLHRFHGKMKGKTFAQRQTDNGAHRITDKTASITFEPIKAFMKWAKATEGLIAVNPAEDVRIVAGKKVKGVKPRHPFTADHLATIFSAPIFTGCRSIHRRYEPGKAIIRDAKYWIPILGLYTGARLGELVQLHFDDVRLDGPIPYLSINENNPSKVASGDKKHVKSNASVRYVPLNPDVMALGFADFVAKRAKRKSKDRVRLFADFLYGSDHQASTVASKWFARFMNSVGLTDKELVFHSFRHSAEDAFKNAGQQPYLIDQIMGHASGKTGDDYGKGTDLEVEYDAIKSMKLKYRVLPGAAPAGACQSMPN